MNPRRWLASVLAVLVTLWVLTEVSAVVLPRLDPTSPFGSVGFAAVATGEAAFGILILALGGWGLYRWAVGGGFGSR